MSSNSQGEVIVADTLSVVVPVYNEEESLNKLYQAICENAAALQQENRIGDFDIWFVDDGSSDKSLEVLKSLAEKDARCRVIVFRRNFGKAAALAAGFAHAQGDIMITMDADFQDDPCDFRRFLDELDKGYDLVSGWKKVRNDPLEKRLPSKLFNKVTSMLSGVKLHDFNCGFKAYRKAAAKSLNIYGEFHRYLPVMAARNGFRVGEITVINHKREFGHSKYGWERYLRGLFDSVSASFLLRYSDRPMYLFGKFALCCGFLAVLLIAAGFFCCGFYGLLTWIAAMFCIVLAIGSFALGLICNLIVDSLWKLSRREDHIKEIVEK